MFVLQTTAIHNVILQSLVALHHVALHQIQILKI